jgi:hypothetical protein
VNSGQCTVIFRVALPRGFWTAFALPSCACFALAGEGCGEWIFPVDSWWILLGISWGLGCCVRCRVLNDVRNTIQYKILS